MPIQTYKQVLFLLTSNRMIKQLIVKGKTDILFRDTVLKSRRVEFDVELALLLHNP